MSDAQTAPKKKKGCLFYGCLAVVIVTVLGAAVTFFAVRYAIRSLHAMMEKYTETQPMTLQPIKLSPEDLKSLRVRVDSFGDSLRKGALSPTELVLTGDEVNALVVGNPGL